MSGTLRAKFHNYVVTSLAPKWRARRMESFLKLTGLRSGMRIVDLGGTSSFWEPFHDKFHVTLVNLPPHPGAEPPPATVHRREVLHDACDLRGIFADNAFDFAFSNSTIEHVGDESRQAAFAAEVHRLASAYWVQTPSNLFPIEAHCLVPFYWQLPQSVRDRLFARWESNAPVWAEMMQDTRVLTRSRMATLFPGASCFTERVGGLEKSYAFYRPLTAAG